MPASAELEATVALDFFIVFVLRVVVVGAASLEVVLCGWILETGAEGMREGRVMVDDDVVVATEMICRTGVGLTIREGFNVA